MRAPPPLRQHRAQCYGVDFTELAYRRRLGPAASERPQRPLVGVGVVHGQRWVESHQPSLAEPVPGPLQVLVRGQLLVERAPFPELTTERPRAVGVAPQRMGLGVLLVLEQGSR